MQLTGDLFIGRGRVATGERFRAVDPATGDLLEPEFSAAGVAEVERACALAEAAFERYAELHVEQRAAFLERIADEIEALGDALIERARAETGLPAARLTGERGRTANQLRLFAAELREGSWMDVRIDPALPAAGCPVVVKGHPAHPGTSELVAGAIARAVADSGLPEGVFSLLSGPSNELGAALVRDPRIKAVGFTGSRGGGMALMKIAAERPEPIPVYAEMSAVNPVLLMPGALEERAEILGEQYAASLSLGAGQFCTNPGVVLAIETPALERFARAAAEAVSKTSGAVMLTPGIHQA